MISSVVGALSIAVAAPAPSSVMNSGGVPYQISNPQGSTSNWKGTPGVYDTNFNTNAGGPVDHFDVYGEVQTKYSQIYWTRNAPVALPPALVKRFAGKVMAITGYEVDQVTHTGPEKSIGGSGGQLGGFSCYPDCSDGDQSVPTYNAYNHHYFGWLQGADSEMFESETPSKLPNPTYTRFRDLPHDHSYPTNIVFKENPGGEFRKSYHGYPAGYAQLLHSPVSWTVEPMQIDTHNRAYGINDEVGYKEWFLPKQDHNNMTSLDSGLSPLIECPCSDRITKTVVKADTILTSGVCSAPIVSQADCAAAVANVAPMASSSTINNASEPSGCLMVPVGNGKYSAIFNTATDKKSCSPTGGDSSSFVWEGPFPSTAIDCEGQCLQPTPEMQCTGEFQGQCTWDSPDTAKEMCGKTETCLGFMCSTQYTTNGKLMCFARGNMDFIKAGTSAQTQSWRKAFPQEAQLTGVSTGFVNMTVDADGSNATISLTGPDGVWFGVGFNAQDMKDAPYAVIVDGAGSVTERRLVEHGPGTLLAASINILTNTVANGVRTVVFSRPMAGKTSQHYTIPSVPGDINIITAVGTSVALSYHGPKRTGSKITLIPKNVTSCMCATKTSEYLTYMNTTTQGFHYDCVDEPRGDMLRHGDGTGRNVQNAACAAETYHGGLRCCQNSWFLTDFEQDSMIPNKTDTYYLKWRYYFQEFSEATPSSPATHQHLHHWVFLIDANVNDYEEDNAQYGQSSIGKIEAHLTMGNIGLEDVPAKFSAISPLVMTPHCHAPSCIREEFWNADTNEIICNITANYGDEKYGSLSNHFNEANYIAIPPCIFGNQTGLQYPFTVTPTTNIRAVKYFNNTYRHLGQMAQWTGLMVYQL